MPNNKIICAKEYKKILLNILICIDKYCKDNEIQYFLYYGSLLGAIRHKGFIPWDDDIDIVIKRKDYAKFISGFQKEKRENYLRVFSLENEKSYCYPFAKVVDTRTVAYENGSNEKGLGIYVDVFPLDFCGNSGKEHSYFFNKICFFKVLRDIKIICLSKSRKLWKNIILLIGKIVIAPLPLKKISRGIDVFAKKYSLEPTDYCVEAVNITYGKKEIMPSKWFEKVIDMPFEGHKFSIPADYNKILKNLYGDYLIYPPVEQRQPKHGIISYYK